MEEIVRAMNFVISQGWAFYWGTSQWLESDILHACEVADRLGLVRPIVEQPEYNLLTRSKVEVEYSSLYKAYGLGLTTWSPLASGLLTGKYANGVPENSRLSSTLFFSFVEQGVGGDINAVVARIEKLRPIADELGCSLAQLAVAWAASNPNVSCVLIGATSVSQLDENLDAIAFVDKITPEIKKCIEAELPFYYKKSEYDMFYTMRAKYL